MGWQAVGRGPVEREPRIQGAESVRQLRRGEVVVDFQTEGEGATLCIGPVQVTGMAANELGHPFLTLLRRFLERMQENQQVRLHREFTPASRKILMALDSLYRVTE